jgi:hypothetical protein
MAMPGGAYDLNSHQIMQSLIDEFDVNLDHPTWD